MSLWVESIKAATTLGPGVSLRFDIPRWFLGIFITATGSPTTVDGSLEGSIDGVTWFQLSNASLTSPAIGVSGPPVLFLRANVTNIVGGTSPTVTAWISAA